MTKTRSSQLYQATVSLHRPLAQPLTVNGNRPSSPARSCSSMDDSVYSEYRRLVVTESLDSTPRSGSPTAFSRQSAVEIGASPACNRNDSNSILELDIYDSSSRTHLRASERDQDATPLELNPFAKLLAPRDSFIAPGADTSQCTTYWPGESAAAPKRSSRASKPKVSRKNRPLSPLLERHGHQREASVTSLSTTYSKYAPPAGSIHTRQASESSQSSSRSKSRELPPLPDTIADSRPTPVAPSQSTLSSKRPLPRIPEDDAVSIASEYSQHSVATLKDALPSTSMSARGDRREPVHARTISTSRVRKVRFELADEWRTQLHRGPEDDAASTASEYSQYSVTTIKEAPLPALPAADNTPSRPPSTSYRYSQQEPVHERIASTTRVRRLRFETAQERRASTSAVKDLPLEPMPYGLKRLESTTAVRRLLLPGSPTVPSVPISSTPPPPPPVISKPPILHQPLASIHHSVFQLEGAEETHHQSTAARDASSPAESTPLPEQASINTDLQLPYPGLAGRDLKSHKQSKQPKPTPPTRKLLPSEVEDLRRGTLKKLFKGGQHPLVKLQDRADKEWLEGRYIECAERVVRDRGRMDAYWTSAAPRYGAVKAVAEKVEMEMGCAAVVVAA